MEDDSYSVSSSEEEEEEFDLSMPEVLEKYKAASQIANGVMLDVLRALQPGKLIHELCAYGDGLIEMRAEGVFKSKKYSKGIAFPTCISVNNCVGHFSPLPDDKTTLKQGDVVKVDLGVHIDGFISLAAHTYIVGTLADNKPWTGKAADVIAAGHFAAECAHRLIRPGNTNTQVTEAIQKVAKVFGCNTVEATLSHQLKRFVIDGNQVIHIRPEIDQQVEEFKFSPYEVYGVDIVMSTGTGKPREELAKPTVFKRNPDQSYLLKLKASRYCLTEINRRFTTMPFPLRLLDPKRGKLGITELIKHDLVQVYPVLYEREGEIVAHFKFTAFLMANSTDRTKPFPLPFVQSQHDVNSDNDVAQILKMSTKKRRKRKKKRGNKQQQQD